MHINPNFFCYSQLLLPYFTLLYHFSISRVVTACIPSLKGFSMGDTNFVGAILVILLAVDAYTAAAAPIYSARLIHRFSGEVWGETTSWPEKKSFWHMRVLLENDLKRQRLRLGSQNQPLVSAQGGHTFNYGNDMGWLHYMWVDIGTPNTSFLVALDTGSDMFWVPCNCIACAPLSYYSMLDKELAEYSPAHSNTSKLIPCSHELCEKGSLCETPKGHCPYLANYQSQDTSSSGFLFEDLLHLATTGENKQQTSVHASIIIGCGSKQTGYYLQKGYAPDGVMGLGPGDISVPSMLAKSGVVPHSYSFCYDKSYSGRLYFGDRGHASQRSTPLLPLKEYRNVYVVEVDHYCVGSSCLKQTGFQALVDTGTSFTYLPSEGYKQVVSEFNRQANATRVIKQDFDSCYDARSLDLSNIPSLKLVFSMNQSFLIENLVVHVVDEQGSFYCLGIYQTDGDIGIIGQNFLMGYSMVFDWEKLKLGWSVSNCDNGANGEVSHVAPPPSKASPNPLPASQQQRDPHNDAVAPAVAGKAPPKPSGARPVLASYHSCITSLSLFLWTAYINYVI